MTPTISEIQTAVCEYYGLKLADMTSDQLSPRLSGPRHLAIYLCLELTKGTQSAIGRRFGGRDHSTVVYARSMVAKRLANDPETAEAERSIRAAIGRAVEIRDVFTLPPDLRPTGLRWG